MAIRLSWRKLVLLGALSTSLTLIGCGDDDGTVMDSGPTDAMILTDAPGLDVTMTDGGPTDAGDDAVTADAGDDAGPTDAGPMDAGDDAGPMDAGDDAGPGPSTSEQIAAVRAAAEGSHDPALAVAGATVTYLRPMIGSDPAGFFVQGEQEGPALFLAIDPTTLDPAPVVGDTVSFDVTETAVSGGQLRVTMATGYMRTAMGADVAPLVQDLSDAADVVSALNDYESEYVTLTGTLQGTFGFAGTGHRRAQFVTAGVDDASLVIRMPDALADTLVEGCQVTAGPAPMWRFNDTAQVNPASMADLSAVTCPAPTVTGAGALDDMRVRVDFSAALDGATVAAEDFAFTGGTAALTATAVAVDGQSVTVTVTGMEADADYTVTVTGVTDGFGTDIDGAMNTAMFTGLGPASAPGVGDVVITEFLYDPSGDAEYVEFYNTSADTTYELLGCTIDDDPTGGAGARMLTDSTRLEPGEYIVLGGNETGSIGPWGLGLNNGGDSIVLSCGGEVIDSVTYDDGPEFPDASGASVQLSAGIFDAEANDNGNVWCLSTAEFGTMGVLGTPGAANDSCPGGLVLFTEMVEGSSSNKAMEITNIGTGPFDLTDCRIARHSNGATSPSTAVTLSGALLPGESFVACNGSIAFPGDTDNMMRDAACDVLNSGISHNGDDAYSLLCPDGAGGETLMDSYGYATGVNPPNFDGTNSMMQSLSGANMTLVRLCSVTAGDTDLTDPADPVMNYDLGEQWDSTNPATPSDSNNDFSGLGTWHCE